MRSDPHPAFPEHAPGGAALEKRAPLTVYLALSLRSLKKSLKKSSGVAHVG
jgi:hypothetical protein